MKRNLRFLWDDPTKKLLAKLPQIDVGDKRMRTICQALFYQRPCSPSAGTRLELVVEDEDSRC